ncbi:MAG: hypothetical protein U1D55_09700 [Phycisphaerae bacterium]
MIVSRVSMLRAVAVALSTFTCAVAAAQLRIVTYNVLQLQGDLNALQSVFASLNVDDKPGFAVAPAVYHFSEVQTADAPVLLARLNAAAPSGITYAQATFTSSGTEDGASGAEALYYRTDMIAEDVGGHLDIFTGASRNTDRWKLRLLNYSSSAATFYVYGSHLPAGTSAEATRLTGVTAIRNNSDLLPAGTHIIYCGDFNMYTNTETGFQRYLAAGAGQAIDPIGPADWTGGVNAAKHTQSTHATQAGAFVGGGMDDRFDQQLSSAAMQDGEGIAIMAVANAYRPFGNDGQHYNLSINSGNNTYYPLDIARANTLATNLFNSSDHIPLVVDYQVPAVMSASLPASFGTVIQGAPLSVSATVSNAANVVTATGADELDYSISCIGGISGTAGGTILALAAPASHLLAIDTSTAGAVGGLVTFSTSSQAAEPPSTQRTITGTVLRHSNASFSSSSDQDSQTLALNYTADTGVQSFSVNVFNFAYDAAQARLDIDGVSGLASPFAFASGLQNGLTTGSAQLNFSFDTTGLSGGVYSDQAVIAVSDEDLPGATSAALTLNIDVTIASGCSLPGDLDHDNFVGSSDLGILLGAWQISAAGDLDGDQQTGPSDLGILLANWERTCP